MNESQASHQMETEDIIIHIDWSGPYTLEEVSHLNGPTDFGVYQIYGGHPVYGSGVLLYIGLDEWQTFAQRLSQHGWCHTNQDAGRLEVHVGRLFGLTTPDCDTWNRYIRLAELLLIHAHRPAWNSQMELKSLEPELRRVHVVNWQRYRSLMPEVSGARWSERFDHIPFRQHFSTEHFGRQPSTT